MIPRVLVDIDGVLANYYKGFAKYLNKKYKTNLDVDREPNEYDMLGWGTNLSQQALDDASKQWIVEDGFRKLQAYKNTKNFMSKLSSMSEIYLVTARIGDFNINFTDKIKSKIVKDTIKWLNACDIKYEKLYFADDKIKFCKKYKINIMIEDRLSTAKRGAENKIVVFLVNRCWNKNSIKNSYLKNVHSYNEIINFFDKI